MPKKINYAESHAIQTVAPAPEPGYLQQYASSDGLHVVLENGTDVVLTGTSSLYIQEEQPIGTHRYQWWQLLPNGDMTLWVNDGP